MLYIKFIFNYYLFFKNKDEEISRKNDSPRLLPSQVAQATQIHTFKTSPLLQNKNQDLIDNQIDGLFNNATNGLSTPQSSSQGSSSILKPTPQKQILQPSPSNIPIPPPFPGKLFQKDSPRQQIKESPPPVPSLLNLKQQTQEASPSLTIKKQQNQQNVDEEIDESEIVPIRESLHEELLKRMTIGRTAQLKENTKKKLVNYITPTSTPEDVRNFLDSKGFSARTVFTFGELTGKQLFTLNKADFEKYCGREEGSRLDSQVTVQKSLCGVSILKTYIYFSYKKNPYFNFYFSIRHELKMN